MLFLRFHSGKVALEGSGNDEEMPKLQMPKFPIHSYADADNRKLLN